MKQTIFIFLISLIYSCVFAQESNQTPNETQTNIKIEKREVGTYNKVKTTKGINVTLVEGDKESIEIHIQNGEPSDVITELNGKTLTLKMRTRIYKDMAVQVYVTYKELIEIEAGVGSSIDCDGAIIADRITLNAGSDASIEIELYAKSVEANLSACRIELSGSTDYQEIKASAATYNALEFKSKEAYVKANTGAKVNIHVTDKLDATATTGSKIYYRGNPGNIEKNATLGGKIEPVE